METVGSSGSAEGLGLGFGQDSTLGCASSSDFCVDFNSPQN